MWRDFLHLALVNPDFSSTFTVALIILAIQTVVRYITKISVFVKEPPDEAEKRAAHFECLRLGLDLSFLGLVAAFTIFQLALKTVTQSDDAVRIGTFQNEFMGLQILLITCTILFTMLFESPVKTFWRGVWVPSIIGFLSVYSSALAFRFFKLG